MKMWHLAIVGFGAQAEKAHLPSIICANKIKLMGIVDMLDSRRSQAKKLCPDVPVAATLSELCELYGVPDIAVLVTPPFQRVEYLKAAKKFGIKRILVEKPLAPDYSSLKKIKHLCGDFTLFPCHTWRYSKLYKTAVKLIRQDLIGDIKRIHFRTLRTQAALGCQEWNPGWRTQRRFSGGGILMDHGYHNLYLLSEILGSFPTHIIRAYLKSNPHEEVESECDVVIGFPDNLTARITLTWNAKLRKIKNHIQGTNGALLITDNKILFSRPGFKPEIMAEESCISKDGIHTEWYFELYSEFERILSSFQQANQIANLAIDVNEFLFKIYNAADIPWENA